MTDLLLITREQAKAAGLKKFFVGEVCKRGHAVEQYVVNRKCVECQRQEMRERYWENPSLCIAKVREWTKANSEKRRLYSKEYKKSKPTTFFVNRRREQDAGRPRPQVCDICAKPNQIKKPIYWDHCHKTGKFRGWICHRCNTILGKVDDNAEMLRKMADYLEQAEPK
jgi:hypothetical protein